MKPPYIKTNSDVAFDKTSVKGIVRLVCRDEKGAILIASFKRVFATSPLWPKLSVFVRQHLWVATSNFSSRIG